MYCSTGFLLKLTAAFACFASSLAQSSSTRPTVTIKNGSYVGLSYPQYSQEAFLGVPFAQPPVGNLRFRNPRPLNSTWRGNRNATAYYPECVGYGGDDIGYSTDEDCLALNVVRPVGYEGQKLPVAVWIHGGGYVMGGTPDKRYNLTFFIQSAVAIGKPLIGVAIPYRLSAWGFLDGKEVRSEGVTNLGMRDQRLALEWISENIAAFGGDPAKVTIWGESAGAGSVGIHTIMYGGRDDGLFRAAIGESGAPILLGPKYNVSQGQATYNNITRATGCANATDSLACLRALDFGTLNKALNVTPSMGFFPYVDGDLIRGPPSEQLRNGSFVKVPYLIGANSDEGTAFGPRGINNDSDFEAYLKGNQISSDVIKNLELVYPDIPALGIPSDLAFSPNSTVGLQYKRSCAFAGDYAMVAPRRFTAQQWAAHNTTTYSYRFDVLVNPLPPLVGATHFQEVAFVFHNTKGLGYAINPFGGESSSASFTGLSKLMTSMWASFVHDLTPNNHNQTGVPEWPAYTNGASKTSNVVGGYGENFLFQVDAPSQPEPDTFRAEGIAYMGTLWASEFGK